MGIFLNNPIYAQKFELDGQRKKYSMSFKMVQNLIIIPLYINEKGPYNFLLDTGVGQMIITDTAFIRKYPIQNFQTIKIHGYGLGESIDAILTRDLNVRVGTTSIKRIPTAIFTEDLFDLSSYLGVHISGILGYYFFNSFQVKINYRRNTLTVYKQGSLQKIKGTKIPIELRNAKPYLNLTVETAKAGKTQLNMLIDNGSSHAMILESYENTPYPLPDTVIQANLGVGINGTINGSIGRIGRVNLGEFEFKNVITAFPNFNKQMTALEGRNRNGSIGADLLKNFTTTFDYANECVYLKKNYNQPPKFDHDMSGIEVYMNTNRGRRYFIGRIEKGSAAENAGLEPGDEFIAVDFRDMYSYNLHDLSELFKSRDGRHIWIEVRRKGAFHICIIKLKKRI